jgi:hypothetical protein
VRKSFGDPVAEDLRYVVKAVVGEENFVDMIPTAPTTTAAAAAADSCSPATRSSAGPTAIKTDQILATGGGLLHHPVPQLPRPGPRPERHQNDHAWQTVHLWTLICLSLGILGPNEREYLGDDLKEVDVFHPESAM